MRKHCKPYSRAPLENAGEIQTVSQFVGLRIAAKRVRAEVSQLHLAEAVGLSRGQITNLEMGRSDIPLTRFLKICDTLNCTADELLEGYW